MIRQLLVLCLLGSLFTGTLLRAEEPAETVAPTLQGALPWQAKSENPDVRVNGITPQGMLKILGIDESHLQQLTDDRDLSGDDDETLTKLLYRLPRFDPPQWERWCQKDVPWNELASSPAAHRADCFIIRGHARHVERVPLIRERVELYEYSHYYRVKVEVEGVSNPIVICTRQIPDQWKNVVELDQPVGVQAMFVKAGEKQDQGRPLYFAAARVAWYPDQVNEELGVTPDQVWLAARGMDLALWDDIRDKNATAISAADAECFYQLLSALKNATPAQVKALPAKPFDLGGLLQSPEKHLADAYVCEGTARLIKKVNVPPDFQKRLGLTHYYEIDLFVPLDKQAVRLSTDAEDKEAPVFTQGFPTTFCVTKLPPELEQKLNAGKDFKDTVRLKGVFYRQWAYNSTFLSKINQKLKQPAPLLMGVEPQYIPNESPIDTGFLTPTTLMFVAIGGMLTIWFITSRFSRGSKTKRRFMASATSRNDSAPPTIGPPEKS